MPKTNTRQIAATVHADAIRKVTRFFDASADQAVLDNRITNALEP